MERWTGKVALVTGASAGIGVAIVEKFVENGMKVVGCARNSEKLNDIATRVNKTGPGEMYAQKCDLNDENDILKIFKFIKEKFGTIHICVNNAGLSHHASLMSGKTEHWREMVNVNILGLCIVTREATTLMKDTGVDDGHIININSMSGHRVTTPFYSATKFAVTALTEGLRQELRAAKSHIRTTSISPGLVETEFAYRMNPDNPERAKKMYANFHCLQSNDIANAVLFAISSPSHMEINDIHIRPTEQKS